MSALSMCPRSSAKAVGSFDTVSMLAVVARSRRRERWYSAALLEWTTITGTSGLPSWSASIEPKSGPAEKTMNAATAILPISEMHALLGLSVIVCAVPTVILDSGDAGTYVAANL